MPKRIATGFVMGGNLTLAVVAMVIAGAVFTYALKAFRPEIGAKVVNQVKSHAHTTAINFNTIMISTEGISH